MENNNALPPVIEARPLLHAQAELGEGAFWNGQDRKLYWVDINGRALHIYDPATDTDQQFDLGEKVGTVVPVQNSDVIVALQTGIHYFNTATGKATLLTNPITAPDIRFNDGKCDPSGRLWVGTLSMEGRHGRAVLYRLDGDGRLHQMLTGLGISNGIVWTSDKQTMYFNDTITQTVQAFDYDDATGSISNRRVAIRIPDSDGSPDGMAIDAEDKLWIALWGAGSVNRYDPQTGALLQQVKVPAPHTSSCALGGPDGKTLFITTARAELNLAELEAFPLSGDLFYATVDVAGVPTPFYRQS